MTYFNLIFLSGKGDEDRSIFYFR